MSRGRLLTVVPWRAGSDEGYGDHPLRKDLVVVSTRGHSDVGRLHLLARSITTPSGAPPTVVLSPPDGRRWTWPRVGETVYADVWDVTGDERYATAAVTGPLPPDGTPVLCACRDPRRRARRARALREHHPEIIRRTGYADEDDPPYARVTASQRFVDPEGRREWMLLHVAPNEKNVPSPLLVTSRYSPAWEEPRPEDILWTDGGSVAVDSWDVSAEPSYAEPADTYPAPVGRPWSAYTLIYSAPRAPVREAFLGLALVLLLVLVSPVLLVVVVVVAVRGWVRRLRTPPTPLPPKPPVPGTRTGPSQDDDLALLGALRSGNVRLVARALSTGTVLLPAVAGGVSTTASSVVPPDLSSRVVEESDGRRLLHVFSTVAAVRAWPTGGRHVVVPGRALVDLAVRAHADHVSIDAGTAHHLGLSTSDLLHHLNTVGPPRHG